MLTLNLIGKSLVEDIDRGKVRKKIRFVKYFFKKKRKSNICLYISDIYSIDFGIHPSSEFKNNEVASIRPITRNKDQFDRCMNHPHIVKLI
jgi:hypothetical protein